MITFWRFSQTRWVGDVKLRDPSEVYSPHWDILYLIWRPIHHAPATCALIPPLETGLRPLWPNTSWYPYPHYDSERKHNDWPITRLTLTSHPACFCHRFLPIFHLVWAVFEGCLLPNEVWAGWFWPKEPRNGGFQEGRSCSWRHRCDSSQAVDGGWMILTPV